MPSLDPAPLSPEQAAQAAVLWRALESVWAGGNYEAKVRHYQDGHLAVHVISSRRIDIPGLLPILIRSTT